MIRRYRTLYCTFVASAEVQTSVETTHEILPYLLPDPGLDPGQTLALLESPLRYRLQANTYMNNDNHPRVCLE